MIKNTSFIEGATYHVYNRGNGHDRIFRNPGNYEYFMMKYLEYMDRHWDTHVWCLMPNHFHFLVTVRKHVDPETISEKCSQAYSNFSNGYVQSFNRQHHRKGSLFMRSFKRKLVNDTNYLKTLTCYIHNNPVKDGLLPSAENWMFNSYKELLHAPPLRYKFHPILSLFGSAEQFRHEHLMHTSPGSINIPYVAA